jgi:hypothetical protein
MLSTFLLLVLIVVGAIVALIVLGVAMVVALIGLAVGLLAVVVVGLVLMYRARRTNLLEKPVYDDLF